MIFAERKTNLINECLIFMNLLMNSIKRYKIDEPFTQLKHVKKKQRHFSKTTDADATKNERFKKEQLSVSASMNLNYC